MVEHSATDPEAQGSGPGAIFTTAHFLRNLQISPISQSVTLCYVSVVKTHPELIDTRRK